MPGAAAAGHAAKKKIQRDSPRVCLACRPYRRRIARYRCQRRKFVDESGVNIAMTRHYGGTVRGQRVHDAVPKNFGRNITILGALSWYGLDAVMSVDGATDAEVFRVYVSRVLAPTLGPGDVVVMGNLSAHKVAGIEAAITSAGAKLVYLPPYSPDWSPIEPCWSAIKTRLRGMQASTRAALNYALTNIVSTVSNRDARGWFAHCGYTVH